MTRKCPYDNCDYKIYWDSSWKYPPKAKEHDQAYTEEVEKFVNHLIDRHASLLHLDTALRGVFE